MKIDRYTTPADVEMRLNGALCRYNGRPVTVRNHGGLFVTVTDILTGQQNLVDANEDVLDISAPPLGYVNIDLPYYVSRDTLRQQKAGVMIGECQILQPSGDRVRWGFPSLVPLANTILGFFPTFESVRAKQEGGAWTRRYAMARVKDQPVIFAASDPVGYYDPDKNSVYLPRPTAALVEDLSKFMEITHA